MIMLSGERWHCTNGSCRCSVLIENSAQISGSNPRCSCGSVMKKDYSPPLFRELEMPDWSEPALLSADSEGK
ncbi:MAG TPA: hypothetical protein VMH48_07730 [Methylomirabilota bacterium]|nr:hypothetical protein [Methylomirabilota bacterium]